MIKENSEFDFTYLSRDLFDFIYPNIVTMGTRATSFV